MLVYVHKYMRIPSMYRVSKGPVGLPGMKGLSGPAMSI